ncbi:NUDIX hydrolase [[Kitasatospora] papulosa]|uniref:NUDIX hydrolase n=1 Tax=[Kitasatospora] papulosa TaxID=1464011 RepID=UPI0036443846
MTTSPAHSHPPQARPAAGGVHVHAWIPNEHGEVLLVPSGSSHMQLPGGPADIADTDVGALVAHVESQVGIVVIPMGLLGTDRLPDVRHLIMLCARVDSTGLARSIDPQRYHWARLDTLQHEMPPRMHRQLTVLWQAWESGRALALSNGRPGVSSRPPTPQV